MPFRGPTPAEVDAVIDSLLPLIAGHSNDPFAHAADMTFAEMETAANLANEGIDAGWRVLAPGGQIELAVDYLWKP